MRLIDIYKETADGVQIVTAGCIQTGEPTLTKGVQSKFYTFSDGSVCCYPMQTARSSVTLELECTQTQASAIESAAAAGALLFAGLRFGTNYAPATALPAGVAYRGYPTGDIRIEEKYALTGIYSVTIPLLLDAAGSTYRSAAVPALIPSLLYLGEVQEPWSRYRMDLIRAGGSPIPALVRTAPRFVSGSTLLVDLRLLCADGRSLDDMTAFIGSTAATVNADGSTAQVTATAALQPGENSITVRCALTGCRELIVRVAAYRQAGGAV